VLQYVAAQRVAVCRSVLHHIFSDCGTFSVGFSNYKFCIVWFCRVLRHDAVCCHVLRCVAVCCSVLQSVKVHCGVLQCVAVCDSVPQCVAPYVQYFENFLQKIQYTHPEFFGCSIKTSSKSSIKKRDLYICKRALPRSSFGRGTKKRPIKETHIIVKEPYKKDVQVCTRNLPLPCSSFGSDTKKCPLHCVRMRKREGEKGCECV